MVGSRMSKRKKKKQTLREKREAKKQAEADRLRRQRIRDYFIMVLGIGFLIVSVYAFFWVLKNPA